MDRREFIQLAAISAASFAVIPLSGCGSKEEEELISPGGPHNVALVYAKRSNSTAALQQINEIKAELNCTVEAQGFLAIVLADGNPQSASTTVELTSTNDQRKKNEIKDDVNSVLETDFSAQAAEVDLFKALSKANSTFAQAPNNGLENLAIIIDSGISTKGSINFTESETRNALLDPSTLVDSLRKQGELAKFEHIDKVIWYGLGQAADPQASPVEGTKEAMKGFYRAIFEAAGVTLPEDDGEVFKTCDDVLPEGELPSVTVVAMPRIPLDENGKPILIGDKLELDESNSALTFAFGTSAFTDSAAAEESLQQYIDQLVDFPDLHVTIYGYTDATGSPEVNQKLSEERAATVGALLESAGVKASQITTEGKGESTAFDNDEQNRRVEIAFG